MALHTTDICLALNEAMQVLRFSCLVRCDAMKFGRNLHGNGEASYLYV